MVKCPRKDKNCKMMHLTKAGASYVCTGITSKPTKHNKDRYKLCLEGLYSDGYFVEMTEEEVVLIARSLLNALSI